MILAVLAMYGVRGIPNRLGWIPLHCPFHGDQHESASVNLKYDAFRCHGCDIRGSAVRIIMLQEGVSRSEAEQRAAQAVADFGGEVQQKPVESRGLPGRSRAALRPRGW